MSGELFSRLPGESALLNFNSRIEKKYEYVSYILQLTQQADGTNQTVLKAQVTGPFLNIIGSAMIEYVQKHGKHHLSALLMLFDWSHKLVASAASRHRVKQSIVLLNSDF